MKLHRVLKKIFYVHLKFGHQMNLVKEVLHVHKHFLFLLGFMLLYKNEENMSMPATIALEKFNNENFKDLKLKTSNLVLNDMYTLTLVADLPGITTALDYIKTFNEKLGGLPEIRNHKFHNFVITKDNFDIFYRTKGLDEYLKFFERNYPAKIQ